MLAWWAAALAVFAELASSGSDASLNFNLFYANTLLFNNLNRYHPVGVIAEYAALLAWFFIFFVAVRWRYSPARAPFERFVGVKIV